MADANITKIITSVKSFFPTAKADITSTSNYLRMQFPWPDTDEGAVTETFVAIGKDAGCEFDGYDEDGFACFIL